MTNSQPGPAIEESGSAQLAGLLAHIRDTTSQVLGEAGATSQSAMLVRYVVDCFTQFARSYYQAFTVALRADPAVTGNPQLYAYQQHRAIERLCSDWDLLVPLLYATADSRVRVLEALFSAALPNPYWIDLMFQQWDARTDALPGKARVRNRAMLTGHRLHFITVPYFSRRFELVRFFYAPYVAISGVPIYDLESPWNWHVVWHEMAGHITQVMHTLHAVERLAGQISTGAAGDAWALWRRLYEHAPGATPAAGDEPWKNVKPIDFVAELLEDAYPALALGPTTLPTLQRVLAQHYRDAYQLEDLRHPPMQMRIDCVATSLLILGSSRDELAQFGMTDEQFQRCEQLAPSVRQIHEALLGNDRPAIVAQRAEKLSAAQIDPLKQHLLVGEAFAGTPSIPTLIAAARQAFEQQPAERAAIAERTMHIVGNTAQTLAAATAGQEPGKPLPLPDDQFFGDLVSGLSWQDLLRTTFQATDFATPFEHGHPHQEVNLRFTSNDGMPHTVVHNQFEHN